MRWRLYILLLLFVIDRIIKNYFWNKSSDFGPDGFLVVVKNSNIAFSLPVPDLIVLPLIIILILFVAWQFGRLYRSRNTSFFFWGLIFMGAVSNLLDRLRWGTVVDYLKLGWWPVFNLSDSLIVSGVIAILLADLFKTRHISPRGENPNI